MIWSEQVLNVLRDYCRHDRHLKTLEIHNVNSLTALPTF